MQTGYRIASLVLLTAVFVSANTQAATTVLVIAPDSAPKVYDAGATTTSALIGGEPLTLINNSLASTSATFTYNIGDLTATSATSTSNTGSLTATSRNYSLASSFPSVSGNYTITTGGTLTLASGTTLTNMGAITTATASPTTGTGSITTVGLTGANSTFANTGSVATTGGTLTLASGTTLTNAVTTTTAPPATITGSTTTGSLTGATGGTLANTGATTVTGDTLTAAHNTTITNTGSFVAPPAIAIGSFAPRSIVFTPLMTQTQADSISTLIRSGLNFVLFGSHHRILQDNGMTNTGSGFWVTGDYAHHNPSSTNASVGEFGFYKDIDNMRLGLGAGNTSINQERQALSQGISGKMDSRYVVFEIDYRSIASGWTGSATVYAGSNSATISRDYMVGATPDLSTGGAKGSSFAIRLRSDWSNATALAGMEISPYLAYTHAESRLNAYTETDGTLPLAFANQKVTSGELRGGVTLLSSLSGQTDLRFPLELAHRKNNSATITGTAATNPFSFNSAGSKQNWARAGIELDHRLSPQTVLNGATIFASQGGDATWLATVSLKHAF